MEFVVIFIQHEEIYDGLLISQVGSVKINTRDLIDYACRDKKVVIVSPTSFLAFLHTVHQGLKALQIEESAVEIRKQVEKLGKHISAYDQFMISLVNSLGTTVNHYNKAHTELKKIDQYVTRISGESPGVEQLELEQPVSA